MNHSDTDWLPLTARPTALIVSAQASMRRMTSAILRQQQYAVTEARNVADGESFLMKASSLSLVIASLQIQVGDDGLSLALRLRRADQHLAILVISQSAPTVDQTRSMSAAGISCLSQDYSFARFVRAISAQQPRQPDIRPPTCPPALTNSPAAAFATLA